MLLLSLLLFAMPCWLWWLLGLLGSFILGWILRCVFGGCGAGDNSENDGLLQKAKLRIAELEADLSKAKASLQEKMNLASSNIAATNSKIEEELKAKLVLVEKDLADKKVSYEAKIAGLETELGTAKTSLQEKMNLASANVAATNSKIEEELKAKLVLAENDFAEKKAAFEAKISSLELELIHLKNKAVAAITPKDFTAASTIMGKKVKENDLKLVEGIGPKIEELFHNAGLKTWASVADSDPAKLKEILAGGGERFQMHDPTTWPQQCQLMVEDKWTELLALQDKLDGGKLVD